MFVTTTALAFTVVRVRGLADTPFFCTTFRAVSEQVQSSFRAVSEQFQSSFFRVFLLKMLQSESRLNKNMYQISIY